MNRKRRENESYEIYKENEKKEEKALQAKLKGKLIWLSSEFGTYRKNSQNKEER